MDLISYNNLNFYFKSKYLLFSLEKNTKKINVCLLVFYKYNFFIMWTIQRTLVVLKPDTIGRSIIWEIIGRFERAWLHIVGMKMVCPDEEFLRGHYEWIGKLWTRKWDEVLNRVVKDMMKNPVIAMVIEWVWVVEYVRKIVWSTEPRSAVPGTIRWDFAHISYAYVDNNPGSSVYNLIHASADLQEAEQEIKHWFSEKEMFNHKPLHSAYTR